MIKPYTAFLNRSEIILHEFSLIVTLVSMCAAVGALMGIFLLSI
jgi:hypothetical protein